ncbi:MAG: nicotinate-nucleotide adenylyltransferase [Firmicutes bacterium]|nr:nicotinate-nucleotide adenylyltransferase [Bacillota bacterium]
MRRLGIMGGTFDPIHYGHLVTAECARYELGLEKVLFIPAGRPPHKPDRRITGPWLRYAMTGLAIASNPFFQASSLEVERPGPSYTIDTVQAITHLFPGAEIYFITGADAVLEILTWKNVEQLLSLCRFIAATRPGYRLMELGEKLYKLPVELKQSIVQNIVLMEVPALAISSTEIRRRVREGRPIKYLLPEPVEEYIIKNNLYRQ